MLHPAFPVSLLALIAPAVVTVGDQAPSRGTVQLTQMSIHERIIIRVPRMSTATRAVAPTAPRYREKKGPKCVAIAEMGGAMIVEPDTVDLVLTGGKRLRAHLDDDCAPMDYYGGFYLRPAADGKVCADRDVIRVRSGASCGITAFRTLQPRR